LLQRRYNTDVFRHWSKNAVYGESAAHAAIVAKPAEERQSRLAGG